MNCSIRTQSLPESTIISRVDLLVRNILLNNLDLQSIINELNFIYPKFMSIYNFDYEYSATINSFFQSTNLIVGHQYPSDVIWSSENTTNLIYWIFRYRLSIQTDDFAFQSQEFNNQEELRIYLSNLLTHYSKLLMVRVDLKYQLDKNEQITIEDFHQHTTKLRELISNKQTCFEHLQGYAWALEQGEQNGHYHCHLLLIYDGAKRQKGWAIAKQVGEKWQKITNSLGTYFNCHDVSYINRYAQLGTLGISMIHRDKQLEVDNAVRSALYLTRPDKIEQRMKVLLPNMRTFGKGVYRTKKRRGLPALER